MLFSQTFKRKISRFAAVLSTTKLMNRAGASLILPFYHLVSDVPVPHVSELYRVKKIEEFEKDLDFLLTHYQPLGIEDLVEISRTGELSKRLGFFLSFDDGLREFYDYIAPILLRKGIPAGCFLNTAFVDNQDLFFRYKVSLLIHHFKNNREDLQIKAVDAWREREPGYSNIIQKLLTIKYDNRDQLDELAKLVGLDFDHYLKTQQPYLTSEQIFELKDQGFYFGGHSVDHPEYQYLELEQQLEQTNQSVASVMEKYKMKYGTFSFPFTDHKVSADFFNTIKKEKQIALTFGTAGLKKEKIPFHFQRIPFEVGNLTAREVLNGELLYYLIKGPLGKNTIHRR